MSLDTSASYSVKGWGGIAFYVHGFPDRWEPNLSGFDTDDDTGEVIEHDTGDGEWIEQDESCGRVIVVMVGDDRKHEVDVSDLTPIPEEAYCSGCGQIGCGWGGH